MRRIVIDSKSIKEGIAQIQVYEFVLQDAEEDDEDDGDQPIRYLGQLITSKGDPEDNILYERLYPKGTSLAIVTQELAEHFAVIRDTVYDYHNSMFNIRRG